MQYGKFRYCIYRTDIGLITGFLTGHYPVRYVLKKMKVIVKMESQTRRNACSTPIVGRLKPANLFNV